MQRELPVPRLAKSKYRLGWILAIPALAVLTFLTIQGIGGLVKRGTDGDMPEHPPIRSFDRLPPEARDTVDRAFEAYLEDEPSTIGRTLQRWTVLAADAPWQDNARLQSEVGEILSKQGFQRRFPGSPSLFFASPSGWRVRMRSTRPGRNLWQGEEQVDQLLATCAGIGVPVQQSVETTRGTVSIGQLLESSRIECVRDQELAWSTVAYCSYLPHQPTWKNRFGEQISYDQVAFDLLARTPGKGPCNGIHTLIAITHILLADDQFTIIAPDTRRHIEARMRDASLLLMQSQLACGAWPTYWAKSSSSDSLASQEADRSPTDLLSVTAHHLEWMIKAPQNLRPDEEAIDNAVRFLLESIKGQDLEDIRKNQCGLSHALRVLLVLTRDNEGKLP